MQNRQDQISAFIPQHAVEKETAALKSVQYVYLDVAIECHSIEFFIIANAIPGGVMSFDATQ